MISPDIPDTKPDDTPSARMMPQVSGLFQAPFPEWVTLHERYWVSFVKRRRTCDEEPRATQIGIGDPSDKPLPPESWYAWERNPNSYAGYNYIGASLLWTYQYPFAWADFRDRREAREPHTDWWENASASSRVEIYDFRTTHAF